MQIGIATPENIYNTAIETTKAIGFKDASRFWTDPATIPPHPPQTPLPIQVEQVKGQMAMQAQQAKAQADAQLAQIKTQADAQAAQVKAAADAQVKQAQMQADAQIAQMKAQLEAVTDKNRNDLEAQRALLETQYKLQLEAYKASSAQDTAITIANINAAAKVEGARVTAAQSDGAALEQAEAKAAGYKISELHDMVKSMVEDSAAPAELVRGPDGMATHVKKGNKMRPIVRNPDGSIVGLH